MSHHLALIAAAVIAISFATTVTVLFALCRAAAIGDHAMDQAIDDRRLLDEQHAARIARRGRPTTSRPTARR